MGVRRAGLRPCGVLLPWAGVCAVLCQGYTEAFTLALAREDPPYNPDPGP